MIFKMYITGFGCIEFIEANSEEQAEAIAWELGKEWLSENLWVEEEEIDFEEEE